jgi:integrase/recombinase XerD
MDFTKYIYDFERELIIQGYSKSTKDNYSSSLKLYLKFFNEYPERINKDQIKNFLYKQSLTHSPESIIQTIATLKKFYKYIINQPHKLDGIENPQRKHKLVEPLSQHEVLKLFSVIKNKKHLAIVSLIYYGALRISELINLKWTDLKRDRGLIFVRQSKGNKDRYVKFYPELIQILTAYYQEYKTNNYIFDGQNREQYSDTSVRQFLKKYSKLSGLKKVCNPHLLRHSFATHIHESGMDIRYIQEYLGHASPKTTQRYTFVSNVSISKFVNPLCQLLCR